METLWATAITLFLIMDPLGNVPIFLVVLERVAEHRRRRIILRELVIALIVMLLFLFAGPSMLRALGITAEAVAIAGGLVLLIIAIRMIFPLRGSSVMGDDDEDHGEPLLVPLAIPLLAGPFAACDPDVARQQRQYPATHPARAAARLGGFSGDFARVPLFVPHLWQPRPEGDGALDGHGADLHLGANAAQRFRAVLH